MRFAPENDIRRKKSGINLEINENEVYTGDEAKQILKISQSTFGRLVKKGVLRAAKVGGQYRVLGREILALFGPRVEGSATSVYRQLRDRVKSWEEVEV